MYLDLCVPDHRKLVLSLHGKRHLESRKVVQVIPKTNDLTMDEYIYFVRLVYFGQPHWTSLELCIIILLVAPLVHESFKEMCGPMSFLGRTRLCL